MRYLAQLSGGMDSLSAVETVLKREPLATCDLLHIQYREVGTIRWLAQLQAALNQKRILQKKYKGAELNFISPIICSREAIQGAPINYRESFYYHTLCASIGSQYKNTYTHVLNGTTKTDCDIIGIQWDEFSTPQGDESSIYAGEKIFQHIVAYHGNSHLTRWRPVIGISKKELYAQLDSELFATVWSCDSPILSGSTCTPCGMCTSCREYVVSAIPLHGALSVEETLPIKQLFDQQISLFDSIIGS